MANYKQCIQIGNDVTNIMKLPCIFSCHKMNEYDLEYLMYDWDKNGQYIALHKGDWVCEDYNGKWHKLTNEEYRRNQ